MKRIFVPTDFSSPSLPAYKFAVELAAEINGEVFVTHMIELPLLQETAFGIQPPPHDAEAIKKLEQKARTSYEQFARAYPANVPVTFTPIQGHVVQEAVSFIEANNIDLVVISTHGASALDDFFTGSTAGKIARSSPAPVISIPRNISLTAIKDLVFANTLELDQHELMRYVRELQQIALRRPYTFIVAALLILLATWKAGVKGKDALNGGGLPRFPQAVQNAATAGRVRLPAAAAEAVAACESAESAVAAKVGVETPAKRAPVSDAVVSPFMMRQLSLLIVIRNSTNDTAHDYPAGGQSKLLDYKRFSTDGEN